MSVIGVQLRDVHAKTIDIRDVTIGLTAPEVQELTRAAASGAVGPLAGKIVDLSQRLGVTYGAMRMILTPFGQTDVPDEHLLEKLAEVFSLQTGRPALLNDLVSVNRRRPLEQSLANSLLQIDTPGKLRQVLNRFHRSRANMRDFDVALRLIKDGESLTRLFSLICDLHMDAFENTGFAGLEMAPVLLTRLGVVGSIDEKTFGRLVDQAEASLTNCAARNVQIIEPICISSMETGRPGPFVKHVAGLINNPEWRHLDSVGRYPYYGGHEATLDAIVRHIETRRQELHCHDVGSIIDLAQRGLLSQDDKEFFLEIMRSSLFAAGFGAGEIARLDDLIMCSTVYPRLGTHSSQDVTAACDLDHRK